MRSETIAPASNFAANVARLLTFVEYRAITTEAELDAVHRLRYDAYLKEGAIGTDESHRLADRYDHLDNVVNIGLFFEDRLVSAMRMHFLAKPDDLSPSMHAFGDYLSPYLAAGNRLVDPNRFVVDYDTARKLPHLAYATTRLTMIAGAYYDARFAVISIRPEHQAFYKRTFFSTLLCPPRPYPGLTKKLCLMLGDFQNDGERIVRRNSFYASTAAEQERLFGAVKRKNGQHAAAAA
jgi:hypothetical protein